MCIRLNGVTKHFPCNPSGFEVLRDCVLIQFHVTVEGNAFSVERSKLHMLVNKHQHSYQLNDLMAAIQFHEY